MRKLSVIAAFLFTTALSFAASKNSIHESQPYQFEMTKHQYKLSEIYQIKSNNHETYPGSVKKSAFRIRTNYDLSNKDGWQATGITRIMSLGAIYPWAKEIDIYDTRGVRVGFIDGQFATLASAKFSLYDYDDSGNYTQIGIAYANSDFSHFVILSSDTNPHPIAELNRNYGANNWSISVQYPEKIDDRMVRIFAGFVVDYQDVFLTSSDNN